MPGELAITVTIHLAFQRPGDWGTDNDRLVVCNTMVLPSLLLSFSLAELSQTGSLVSTLGSNEWMRGCSANVVVLH